MKSLQRRTKSAAQRGFTLIEIMVATVIMVVLVGLVIQITSEVLKVWTRSSGKMAANAEARIAMELITQDLETAVLRNNGQQWLRVEAPADNLPDIFWPPRELAVWMQGRYRWRQLSVAVQENRSAEYPFL